MKIYTKYGDKGFTALVGGKKVSKASTRVNAYGTIDELNTSIGVLRAYCADEEIKKLLLNIQRQLFSVGGEIACPTEKEIEKIPNTIQDSDIEFFENKIDQINEKLSPIKDFIIPGENILSAHAHVATTTCRKAERTIIGLAEKEFIRPQLMVYMNRLSDLLFTIARLFSPENEEFWKK